MTRRPRYERPEPAEVALAIFAAIVGLVCWVAALCALTPVNPLP